MDTDTVAEIVAEIERIAQESLGWTGDLTPDTPLVAALQLDSMRMLTLVVAIEDHFQVALEQGDETGLQTVGELAALILRRRQT